MESIGVDATNSTGTVVGGAGTIVQLIASTSFDYDRIIVTYETPTIANATLDILIGSSGHEQLLITLAVQSIFSGSIGPSVQSIPLPLAIPKGTRVSARINSAEVVDTVVTVNGMSGGISAGSGYTSAVTMGNSSNSGTVIDPGGTQNTLGAWTQIIASTSNSFSALMLMPDNQLNTSGGAAGGTSWLIDIGVGGSGSEYALVSKLWWFAGASSDYPIYPFSFGPFPCSIPAGTRLSVRAQCSTNVSPNRKFGATLYGFI
jgi:hypothetical protein